MDDPAAAGAAAAELGFPVVVKLNGDRIAHKTERGLVRLEPRHPGGGRAGRRRPAGGGRPGRRRGRAPGGADGAGQPGAHRRPQPGPQFGMTVMLGVGGILAEALADVVFRLVPLDRLDALDMVDQLRTQALLGAFRGEPAVDRDLLADVLVGLARRRGRCHHRVGRPQPADRGRRLRSPSARWWRSRHERAQASGQGLDRPLHSSSPCSSPGAWW